MTSLIISITVSDSQGQWQFTARKMPLKIGREPISSIDLAINGKFVSGNHCEFYEDNGHLYLKDYSKNGTYVNGQHIHHAACLLKEHDTLQLCKKNSKEYENYPLIIINRGEGIESLSKATPVAKTPIAPLQSGGDTQALNSFNVPATPIPPMFRLAINADSYHKIINVMELPCIIGRCPIDGECATRVYVPSYYSVDEQEQLPTDPKLSEVAIIKQDVSILMLMNTVSRSHLIIHSFNGIHAQLEHIGEHSCRVNDSPILDDDFQVEVDDVVTLGNDIIPTNIQIQFDVGCAV